MLNLKVVNNPADLLKVFFVRGVVFVEEQQFSYGEEMDGNDYNSCHFLGEIDGEPVAAARVMFFNSYVKLGRFAVRKNFRKQNIGRDLMLFVIDYIEGKGFQKIILHAQVDAVPFYLKFGFIQKGSSFKEAGVDHYLMERIQ